MKAILTGCAIAALLVGSAAAQGRGVGGGIGGGIGAGVGGGVGVGGMGGMGGMGVGVGAGMNTGLSTRAPDISGGRADTATSVRGAADVLPDTRGSAQGRTSGARSSANAAADASSPASANTSAADHRAATTDIRAGALVKSTAGATLGRIESVTPATGAAAATVTIRSGADTWTMPQSELNASGDFLVTSRNRP